MNRLPIIGLALMLFLLTPAAARAASGWITHPDVSSAGTRSKPVSLQFRRDFLLQKRLKHFVVRVSADNRFLLFVNGRRVAQGPAYGDLRRWRYERLDLAPYLTRGRNVIAAQVWNDAGVAPAAQLSARTAFIFQAEAAAHRGLNTGPPWRVRIDRSRSVGSGTVQMLRAFGDIHNHYYTAGAPETHTAAERLWDWQDLQTSGPDWKEPVDAVASGETAPWLLVENRLPQMRYVRVDSGRVARAVGVAGGRFPAGSVRVPANSEAVLLIDAGRVLAAYPELVVSGGRAAEIKLTYTEALYDSAKQRLADRASINGQVLGISDVIRPDGGLRRTYQPNWYRVWRFVEVRIKTGSDPLTLNALNTYETGYPFTQRGRFKSSDPALDAIWTIGWRTTLVDAHEIYMDTAYWEQIQYAGDTRIEALISYAVSGDPRLGEQALDAYDASRIVDGYPQGAWPLRGKNDIPSFALIWIGMLHDYWMRYPTVEPVKRNLTGARSVLDRYARYLSARGIVEGDPGWQFIDWRPTLSGRNLAGPPPKPATCVTTLLYIGALRNMADLEAAVGDRRLAEANRLQAARATEGVRSHCWDPVRGLFADTPDSDTFSQQGNALAILLDVAPAAGRAAIIDRILLPGRGLAAPAGVTSSTYYFAFYLARALEHAGEGGRYMGVLQAWREMLAKNFTTWPEEPDPTRSDTHAWSAHPTADLLGIVAGISPASPGYRTVRVAPHLGHLTFVDAAAAHPEGLIETRFTRSRTGLSAKIKLPKGIAGAFVWNGQERPLRPGLNRISIKTGEQ